MYIKRHIEDVIEKRAKTYPVVLVTGSRQTGKSTMLKNTVAKDIPKFTMDNRALLSSVLIDPQGFIKDNLPPIFIDEIQDAPELFHAIKMVCDDNSLKDGLYFITGSQKYVLMQGVSESLAGRISILDLHAFSLREISGDKFATPFLPTTDYYSSRKPQFNLDSKKLWQYIQHGLLPKPAVREDVEWEPYYSDYLNTYLERDVRKLSQVGDLITFTNFMTALAARTGQIVNYAALAKDVGVSETTIKRWISILEATNIIYLLQPYFANISKRVIKAPKVYFFDTGLVSYLCRWLTPETLQNGAMSGAIFETFVVSEILKSYCNAGKKPPLYYFRNDKGQEVDLLIYQNGELYPIEIKKTASPNAKNVSVFNILADIYPNVKIKTGALVCMCDSVLSLGDNAKAVPINYI